MASIDSETAPRDDDLRAAVARTLAAAGAHRGREPSAEFRDSLNALAGLPRAERSGLRKRLAEGLSGVESATGAGFLALWLGSAVENGADPTPVLPHLLDHFLRLTGTLETTEDEEEDPGELNLDEETLVGLEFLGQALVAHLSRCPEQRAESVADPNVIDELERVEHISVGAMWVLALLRQSSGELLVLHAERNVGVRVRYENVGNCFHLFTLLQGALANVMPGAGVVAERVLAIAQGAERGECHDSAWWHYGQGNVPSAEFLGMVFGELTPDAISRVEGEQVLLLWPPLLESRSWDSGFFGPFLEASPPRVRLLGELSREEVDEWRVRLRL